MIEDAVLDAAERYAQKFFAQDASGHDWHHTMRVRRTAERIAVEEGADVSVVALAALLHDVDDAKLSPETSGDLGNARSFLAEQGVGGEERDAVLTAIREVSFSKNGAAKPSTLESACVRDADRLDAIGAIGVARAFAFGGVHGRALHDPSGADKTATTDHFHEKLFKLKDLMCTGAGRRIAAHRDTVTREFLDEFLREWDGNA
ncbi:MAG: HD domain-containing protein [Coriobacteriia bacterium]|nr:HD domain-containing protein [Coriobacteriia bacterium]